MNTNRAKSIPTMPMKLIVVLSAALSISTGVFAQDSSMRYLKSTPASLYDIGMVRLEYFLKEIDELDYHDWMKNLDISGPSQIFEDEIKIYLSNDVRVRGQPQNKDKFIKYCKEAFAYLRYIGGVEKDGTLSNPQFGQTRFSGFFFPVDFNDWPDNYLEIGHALNNKFLLKCEVYNIEGQTKPLTLESKLLSSKIVEILE